MPSKRTLFSGAAVMVSMLLLLIPAYLYTETSLTAELSASTSSAAPQCGNGIVEPGEDCDDANQVVQDGCSLCRLEEGYMCRGAPSVCVPANDAPGCGNGQIDEGEQCDDANKLDGDGCAATCQIEAGFLCESQPSTCRSTGFSSSSSSSSSSELSSSIASVPASSSTPIALPSSSSSSVAAPAASASSTPAPATSSSSLTGRTRTQTSFSRAPMTNDSTPTCGNGFIERGEVCDDGGTSDGDGCSATCQVERGYACRDTPSFCEIKCGDGIILGGEICDDGNTADADGCNATCHIEFGFQCKGEPSKCLLLSTGGSSSSVSS